MCRRGRDGFFFYTSPLFTRLFFSAEEITRLMHSLHWAIFWVRMRMRERGGEGVIHQYVARLPGWTGGESLHP